MRFDLQVLVPKGWSWLPLKYVIDSANRGLTPAYVEDSTLRVIGQISNRGGRIDWGRTRFHAHEGNLSGLRGLLRSGDILVNSTGTGTLGRVSYFSADPAGLACAADSHITVVRSNVAALEPKYLYYWLASSLAFDFMYSALVVGATNQIELNRDRLLALPVAVPPIDDQRRLIKYLDLEVGRIDQLSSGYQRVIDLLEERADSALRAMVGKSSLGGGRSDLIRIRRVLKKMNRRVVDTDEVVTAFRDGQVIARSKRRAEGYTLSAEAVPQGQAVQVGDVVVHGLDGFAGAIGTSESLGNCSPVYHICASASVNSAQFYGRFLRVLAVYGYLGLFATSTRERAVDFRSWELFGDIPIPAVELSEQEELGELFSLLRPLRDHVTELKSRLAERRQALITAAVTGQIDVVAASGLAV